MTHELLDARVMAESQVPGGPMSYLVTPPARHTFRILGSQPILDADGTKLGTLLSYVGDTRDPEAATAEAVELMNAYGLEAQTASDTAILVQARVGFDPRKRLNSTIGFHVSFQLKDGRWSQLPKPLRRRSRRRFPQPGRRITTSVIEPIVPQRRRRRARSAVSCLPFQSFPWSAWTAPSSASGVTSRKLWLRRRSTARTSMPGASAATAARTCA